MAFPEYVPVRAVSVGGAMVIESSDLIRIRVTIKASKSLVWDATGYRFEKRQAGVIATSELGSEVTISLPRTDVAGWRDPALNAIIDVSAEGSYTHRYTALVEFLDANLKSLGISPVTLGPFVVPAGDGTIDLDKTVPASSVSGELIMVPDLWGQLVAEAQAAAVAAAAVIPTTDAAMALVASDPESDFAIQQAATIVAALPLAPRQRPLPPIQGSRVILIPASGHGWSMTTGASGSAVTEDTNRPGPFSDRSIKVSRVTDNAELISPMLAAPIDLTDGPITVWVYLPDEAPKGIFVQALSNGGTGNFYQWDRYGVAATGSSSPHVDGWTAFELFYSSTTTMVGTPDPANITQLRIRASGNDTIVWLGGIVQRPTPELFPNGVASIYFDDGYSSTYDLAMPVLASRGAVGVVSVIAASVGESGFMDVPTLRKLQERSGWEICGHSWSPNGAEYRLDQFDPKELEDEFRNLKAWLVANGFETETWVSPGGVSNAGIWDVGRKFFAIHRGVAPAGTNGIRQASESASPQPMYPAFLPSANFHVADMTVANMKAALDAIKAKKSWGSLTFHEVTTGASSGLSASVADLSEVIAYANTIGVPIRTPRQVLDSVNRPGFAS